ncbi:MAG: TlpA family protein disulfide reductase [Acidimicrobiales bacterium]
MTGTRARSQPPRRQGTQTDVRRRWLLLAGGAAAAAVVLFAVVIDRGGSSESGDPAPSDTAEVRQLPPGDVLPTDRQRAPTGTAGQPASGDAADFSLPIATGGDFRLADHRGDVVILNFAALGCPSCSAGIPMLAATADTFAQDNVQVAVVDLTGDVVPPRDVVDYYTSVGGNDRLVYALDTSFEVMRAYGVNALGTIVVIDPTGTIRFRDDAMPSAETLEGWIGEAMA